MPNHPSAIKRNRQSIKRRTRNRALRSEIRSAMRETRSLASAGNLDGAKTALRKAESLLSRASAKGIYHHKNASRKIGRLASFVSKSMTTKGTTKTTSSKAGSAKSAK